MKKSLDWHHTRLGGVILFLGSIQLAVPVLFLVAIGLGVGTYLDSKQNATVAREYVYGSWWFIGLMVLTCVSLIFAVFTRYPWKRKHIGFITVHASLVALIAGGFWSMFGRIDGNLRLEEGTMHNVIETAAERLEVLEPSPNGPQSMASVPAPMGRKSLSLAGVPVEVMERWENSREEEAVADDSPVPLRAVEIAPVAGPQTAWVGQEDQAGPAPTLLKLKVLVLPEGSDWQPPTPTNVPKGEFVFVVGSEHFPLKGVGEEVFPGWKIVELTRYERAMVAGDAITEGPTSAPANPAVQVKIANGTTTEQHTAFADFPDMIMGKTIEGTGNSASRLVAGGASVGEELVVFGTVAKTKIGYVGLDGKGRVIEPEQTYPMTLDFGSREVTIHKQLARAHVTISNVQAPVAKNNRPALLVRVGDSQNLDVLLWHDTIVVTAPDKRQVMLHFGPERKLLPFWVRLDKFHKVDYPGTDMAMSYQSDVGIIFPGQAEKKFDIYMNHPYAHGPWKVYQSSFQGTTVSVFSVMHDPGLWLTYIASAFLCLGVVVTFYSRSMSWGHPGIPIRPETTQGVE